MLLLLRHIASWLLPTSPLPISSSCSVAGWPDSDPDLDQFFQLGRFPFSSLRVIQRLADRAIRDSDGHSIVVLLRSAGAAAGATHPNYADENEASELRNLPSLSISPSLSLARRPLWEFQI